MNPQSNRMRQFLIIGGVAFVILAIILSIVGLLLNKNPYGESIQIQNYNNKIKNISNDYENNIEAQLYKAVQFNSEDKVNGAEVKDAFIRDGSDKQTEARKDVQYSGSFVVDIESRKESYKVQYAYSRNANDEFVSGYPVTVTCVDPSEVKYKEFNCKDGSENNTIQGKNAIINFLPHETVSYTLRAELVDDTLTLHAELYIPSIDLSGNEASRREVVTMYKNEVTQWITAQGFKPEEYTIEYNYTDDGTKIIEDPRNHGEEDI